MLEAALSYAAQGWHVFPCHVPIFEQGTVRCSCAKGIHCGTKGKHPRGTEHGLLEATSDLAQITRWWTQFPDSNIGGLPGSVGLVAWDLDTPAAEKAAIEMGLYAEPTLTIKTGKPDATHRYFKVTNPPASGANVNGIIVRSKRGLVILPPSLHESGNRYHVLDETPPIELPPRAAEAVAKAASGEGRKARVRYAVHTQSIGPGERHAALLTLAGTLASAQVPEETAIQLVMDTNVARCHPPKPREEVVDMVQYTYAKEHQKFSDVAKHLMVAHVKPSGPRLVKDVPAERNPFDDPLPGILEDIVQWSLSTAPGPVRIYSVAAAIAVASTVCARRYTSSANNYATLYVLVVGRSGTGKEHVRRSVTALLRAADAARLIGPNEWTSRSAVWSSVFVQPQSLAVIDEFGQFLGAASGGSDGATMKNGVLTALMELFGRVDDFAITPQFSTLTLNEKQRRAADRKVIERPALSLIGLTTPEEWYDSLKSSRISSGFLNRFLVMEADVPRGDLAIPGDASPPAALVDWVRAILKPKGDLDTTNRITEIPTPHRLTINDAAYDAFINFRRGCNRQADALEKEKLGELPMRAAEMAMRLALISALARDAAATSIDTTDAYWGIRVAAYLLNQLIPSVRSRMADSPTHALRNRFLQSLREAGDRGLTAKELYRCPVFRGTPKRDRDETIEWAQHATYAAWTDVPHKGAGAPRKALVLQSITAIEASEDVA